VTADTVAGKAYFAGSTINLTNSDYGCTDRIDIYDESIDSWSISSLSEGKGGHVGVSVYDKIYWAGGRRNMGLFPNTSCLVELFLSIILFMWPGSNRRCFI